MAFHTRFSPVRVKGVINDAPSLVQPQFQRSCDISVMIRRALGGDSTVLRKTQFVDASGAPEDFADAQFRLARARTVWNDLPDHLKQSFGSPERLVVEFDRFVAERKKQAVKPASQAASAAPSPSDKTALSSTDDAYASNT